MSWQLALGMIAIRSGSLALSRNLWRQLRLIVFLFRLWTFLGSKEVCRAACRSLAVWFSPTSLRVLLLLGEWRHREHTEEGSDSLWLLLLLLWYICECFYILIQMEWNGHQEARSLETGHRYNAVFPPFEQWSCFFSLICLLTQCSLSHWGVDGTRNETVNERQGRPAEGALSTPILSLAAVDHADRSWSLGGRASPSLCSFLSSYLYW